MKCPSFNPDRILGIRIVCLKHKKKIMDSFFSNVCPCLYGLDDDSVNDLIDNKNNREEIITIEKYKWIVKSDEKASYNLKIERKEEILQ